MCLGTLAVAGSAISALGAVGSGIAQGNAAAYNAQVASNNAIIARQNATYATQAGYASAQDEGLKAAEQLGQTGAAISANNITDTGSASKVLQGAREYGALDQSQVMQQAETQAYGYRTQATGFEATAGLESAEAGFDPLAGVVSGTGSFLSGLSNVATKFPGTFLASSSSPNSNAIGSGS
jgi:hypothetical protein